MTDERHPHVALPKLYGAPTTPRQVAAVAHSPRPFDPDDLPLEAELTEDEREFIQSLPPRAFAPGGGIVPGEGDAAQAQSEADRRNSGKRSFASRLFGGSSSGAA